MIPAHQVASSLITTSKQKRSSSLDNLSYSLASREQRGYFAKKQQVLIHKKSVEAALAQNNYTQAILDCEAIYRLTVPYPLSFDKKIITNHYQLALTSSSENPDWIEYRRLGCDLLKFVITQFGIKELINLMLAGSEWALANISFYLLDNKKKVPLDVIREDDVMQLKQHHMFLYYYFATIIPLAQRSDQLSIEQNKQLMDKSSTAIKEFQKQLGSLGNQAQTWFSIIQIHYFFMLGIAPQDPKATLIHLFNAIEHQIILSIPLLFIFFSNFSSNLKSKHFSLLFWLHNHLLGVSTTALPANLCQEFAELCLAEHQAYPNNSTLTNHFLLANLRLPINTSGALFIEIDICKFVQPLIYVFNPPHLIDFMQSLAQDSQMESFNNVSAKWKDCVHQLRLLEFAKIMLGNQAYQTKIKAIKQQLATGEQRRPTPSLST